jgi:uncharacterized membrane protein
MKIKTRHFLIATIVFIILTFTFTVKNTFNRLEDNEDGIYYYLRNFFFVLYLVSFIATIISYYYHKKQK